jgi:hypothetical protein
MTLADSTALEQLLQVREDATRKASRNNNRVSDVFGRGMEALNMKLAPWPVMRDPPRPVLTYILKDEVSV